MARAWDTVAEGEAMLVLQSVETRLGEALAALEAERAAHQVTKVSLDAANKMIGQALDNISQDRDFGQKIAKELGCPLGGNILATVTKDYMRLREAHEETKRQLAKLLSLPPGWDSYAGAPVDAGAASTAMHLLRFLSREQVPWPTLVPTVTGGIQLEWYGGGIEAQLEIEPGSPSVTLFYRHLQSGDSHDVKMVELRQAHEETKQQLAEIRAVLAATQELLNEAGDELNALRATEPKP